MGALVARLSRGGAGCVCRDDPFDPRRECRLFLPGRRVAGSLGQGTAASLHASHRGASPQQGLDLDCIRHDRQHRLRQQLHQGGLPALPAALSVGMAAYSILAKIDRSRQLQLTPSGLDCGRLRPLAVPTNPEPGGQVPPGFFLHLSARLQDRNGGLRRAAASCGSMRINPKVAA
jgi:hypothetical protein